MTHCTMSRVTDFPFLIFPFLNLINSVFLRFTFCVPLMYFHKHTNTQHLNQTTGDHLCVKLIWRNSYKYQCSQVLTISVFKMTLESPFT